MDLKAKILAALRIFHQVLKEETLQTLEEVEANTESGHLVGAEVVKELNDKLPKFLYDKSGKITGYKTAGGADTVFPFSAANFALFSGSISVTGRNGAKNAGPLAVVGCAGFTKKYDTQLTCEETGMYDIYYIMLPTNTHYTNVGGFILKVNGEPIITNSNGGYAGKHYAFASAKINLLKGDAVDVEISITRNSNEDSATVTEMVQCCIYKQQSV